MYKIGKLTKIIGTLIDLKKIYLCHGMFLNLTVNELKLLSSNAKQTHTMNWLCEVIFVRYLKRPLQKMTSKKYHFILARLVSYETPQETIAENIDFQN